MARPQTRDEFDELPARMARVGVHRAPAPRGRGWLRFLWGVVAAVLLSVVGVFGLSQVIDLDLSRVWGVQPTAGPSLSPSPLPTAEPVTNPKDVPAKPKLTISVLNASATANAQTAVGDLIAKAGWPDPARARAGSEVEETTIYYRSADFEGVARGLAQLIGGARVVLSDAYRGAPVTIVVGNDWAPPAA